jgi:hypothetical protein
MKRQEIGIPALLAAAKQIAETTTEEDVAAMNNRMCEADKQGEKENLAMSATLKWGNGQYTL